MVQPVRFQSEVRAPSQGPELREHRGGPQEQERAPPEEQPRAQEGPRALPQRQAALRVHGHRRVHRGGLRRRRAGRRPRRPLRTRRRSLLGQLHRQQASGAVVPGVQGQDEGGEGGRAEADVRGGGGPGGGLQGVLQGEALLRRRRRRDRRRRARKPARVAARVGGAVRHQALRPGQDAAPAGVGGALHRAGRREGVHAGVRQAARVRQDEADRDRCRECQQMITEYRRLAGSLYCAAMNKQRVHVQRKKKKRGFARSSLLCNHTAHALLLHV